MKTYDPQSNGRHTVVPTPWGDAHAVERTDGAAEVFAPDGALVGFAYAFNKADNLLAWVGENLDGTAPASSMGSLVVTVLTIIRRSQPVQRRLYVQVRDGAEGTVIYERVVKVEDRGLADNETKAAMGKEAIGIANS